MQVKDIHASPHATYCYLWTVEGMREMWCSHHAIAGSGAGSWVGTDHGDRIVKPGLMVPERLSLGRLEPWAAEVEERPVTVKLVDLDLSLAGLFRSRYTDEFVSYMGQALTPLDDPAPIEVLGMGGTPVAIDRMHIGLEAFGPEGERRHYWLAPNVGPGHKPPGLDHPAVPLQQITPGPQTWTNRRCALWRIVQDPDTGEWPSWEEQYLGGSMIWFGSMRDFGEWEHDPETGPTWSFSLIGPWSWTKRVFNSARPHKPTHPSPALALTPEQAHVAMWIGPPELSYEGEYLVETQYNAAIFHPDHSLVGLDLNQIRQRLHNVMQVMISGETSGDVDGSTTYRVGADNVFWRVVAHPTKRKASWSSSDKIKIQMENDSEFALFFALTIVLHAKVWAALGWDVHAQPGFKKVTELWDVLPVGGAPWNAPEGANTIPGAGYYRGYFPTHPLPVGDLPDSKKDNQGVAVIHHAMWPLGTVVLDPSPGQILRFGTGEFNTRGQLAAVLGINSTIDGEPCDAAGWWLFEGVRLDPGEKEAKPYHQVALCSWISGENGGIAVAFDGLAAVKIERWENPRLWGFDEERMLTPWVSDPSTLRVIPMAAIGGLAGNEPDFAHLLLTRWLLSSGTAYWDGVQLVPGVNQPEGLVASQVWGGDLEVADLGCGIPPAFVDEQSGFELAKSLPGGGVNSPLNRVHYSAIGPRPSSELWRELLAGRGWAWTLERNPDTGVLRFGWFDPVASIGPEQATVVITDADLHGWGRIEQRDGGPYDRFPIEVGRNPLTREFGYKLEIQSLDENAHVRHGQIKWPITDGGLRKTSLFPGQASIYAWEDAARQRFGSQFGKWHSQKNFILHLPVKAHLAHRLGIGTKVWVKAGHIPHPEGGYGIDHFGFVLEVEHLLTGEYAGAVALRIQMQARGFAQKRKWGPVAWGYEYDPVTGKLNISANFAKRKPPWDDTTGFVKPPWAEGEGPLRIAIFQSEDGGYKYPDEWVVKADVIAADPVGHTLTLANLTSPNPKGPKIYRKMIKWVVGAKWSDQVPGGWAQRIFAYNTRPDGTFGDPPQKGFRL